MNEPAIAISGLRVVRGNRLVLRDIELTIERGRVTGLVGPSGSGKTTLLRAIVGSQILAGGEVLVFGVPAGAPELRRRVAYVTQALGLYADLTVRENLRFFSKILAVPDARIQEVVETVYLADQAGQLVGELSDGQRARVSLATALLGQPGLLILDEPTAAVDPLLRRELWELFADLASQGTTLIVSSHVMDEARRCDQLALLAEGRLVSLGSPAELRQRTGTEDVESAFLKVLEGETR